jgi:signal transduction histidine kinase/CheY-like chemotaxis protein
MTFQNNPAAIPFGVAVLISGTLMVFAWRRRTMPTAPAFAFMMAGEAIWALGEALELEFVPLPVKLFGYSLRTTGAMVTTVGLLAFVLRFTGHGDWLPSRWFSSACALALGLTVLSWTNPWHSLIWSEVWIEQLGGYAIAMHKYGPAFWVCLSYCYAVAAVSAVLLGQTVLRATGIYRDQAAIMLFGVLLPLSVSAIDLSEVFGAIQIDMVVISFVVTGLAFLPGLFRYRLLDLTPVAWGVVVKGIRDPVVVVDLWGRIVELNPAAQRLVDLKPNVIGEEASRAFRNWPALAQRLARIEEQGETTFEIDGPDPGVPSWFDARISKFGDGVRPSGWVVVMRDITEHRRAEAERLRMLREQAARAEAEAASLAKDRFLATLSHELRTPLTPVLATVTAMLADPATAGSLRPIMEMIRRNVVLETRLIDDLLDLSRIRQSKLHLDRQIIDAHELIEQVVEICWDDLQVAGLQLRTNLAAGTYHLDADPVRLQQVLWNLIKNAIKFTAEGGIVTVRSRNRNPGKNGPTQDRDSCNLEVEVSDTGIGIEPEVLPRIFEMFEQGRSDALRRQGGLGLGLTISRSIAEQHGGRLSAASPGVGRGSTFTLEMPAVPEPNLSSMNAPISPGPDAGLGARRTLRILLVEDNGDTLTYLSGLLSRRGHTVSAASSLSAARQLAAEGDFDLLISDIELADGTGFELMWLLRSRCDAPGIALSGFGSPDDIELSQSAGFALHLTKPVDFRRLEEAIEQLAGQSWPSTLIQG